MTPIIIRDARAADFDRIVALNETEVQQTSPMDLARLRELAQLSSHHKVAVVHGHVAAFLLAMRENARYQNENYSWFSARFSRFVYVDRIVVGSDFAGRQIGSRLYQDVFGYARSRGIGTVACEYNIQPPNPASRALHHKFGFTEIGTQWLANGTRQVSLQAART
jgi:predicted GNAT superfamily acetyltransferase